VNDTTPISIRAVDLGFSYPRRRRDGERPAFRLRCRHWEVARGDRVALTGPSGCGKTTLLNLVGGVLSPDRGTLEVEGRELYRLNGALSLDGSVRKRARRLLDSLGLPGRRRSRPRELSQGEQQRVAIARALITEPTLLLADEPTAGLDRRRSADVMELLENLSAERNLTLIMVTHDPSLLTRFDQVLDLERLVGSAEEDG
jgi:ABC-type lipoprotein export system ATPase subunit